MTQFSRIASLVLVAHCAAGESYPLPRAGSVTFLQDGRENIYLATSAADKGGLFLLSGANATPLSQTPVEDAVMEPGGSAVLLSDGGVYRVRRASRFDDTGSFGGSPGAAIFQASDGRVFVEGAAKLRSPSKGYVDAPRLKRNTPAPRTQDIFGNLWTLSPVDERGGSELAVLRPDAKAWAVDTLSGVGPGKWSQLIADGSGHLWIARETELRRIDIRNPRSGSVRFTRADGLPGGMITTVGLGRDGEVLVGFDDGRIVACGVGARDIKEVNGLRLPWRSEERVRAIFTDTRGRIWVAQGDQARHSPEPRSPAWQRSWQRVAALPGGRHQVSSATYRERTYMAGGVTDAYAYPAQSHAFRDILSFDPLRELWTKQGELTLARAQHGCAEYGGEVWFVNGLLFPAGRGSPSETVEVYNIGARTSRQAPSTSVPREIAVAARLGRRIYVVGKTPGGEDAVSTMESIGAGDKVWRPEVAAPVRLGAPVGCAYNNRFYIWDHLGGVLIYDPADKTWTSGLPMPPKRPRTPQVVVHNGDLWLLGGHGISRTTTVSRFNLKTRTWRAGPGLPRPMAWGTAASVKGRLYITAGAAGRSGSDTTYVLRP